LALVRISKRRLAQTPLQSAVQATLAEPAERAPTTRPRDALETEGFDCVGANVRDGFFYGIGRVNRTPPNPWRAWSGFFKAPAAITERDSQQF
jgi:hypothetical protein